MPVKLKPVKVDESRHVIPASSSKRVAYWRVTLGKKLTGGRKQRRFFKTYTDATEFIDSALGARKVQGHEAFSIPQALRVEALDCQKRLAPAGVSLTTAVSYYLRHAVPPGGVRTFEAVCEEFVKSRRAMGCKVKTMIQYESYVSVLSTAFGSEKMNALSASDIEEWLDEYSRQDADGKAHAISGRTKKNYLTTLKTIFNYAVMKDYCVTNPALKVDPPILDERPVGVLTPDQATKLLARALANSPRMVPSIAIGLFAGLRRSEVSALDWNEVDLASKTIVVQGHKAKTRQRRVVGISENLLAWLKLAPENAGLVGFNADVFGEKLRELVRGKCGADDLPQEEIIAEWPHNALRHSFGSYHYAKHKNENLTAAEMGNTPDVVHKHYRAIVRDNDVVQFWNITPAPGQDAPERPAKLA